MPESYEGFDNGARSHKNTEVMNTGKFLKGGPSGKCIDTLTKDENEESITTRYKREPNSFVEDIFMLVERLLYGHSYLMTMQGFN